MTPEEITQIADEEQIMRWAQEANTEELAVIDAIEVYCEAAKVLAAQLPGEVTSGIITFESAKVCELVQAKGPGVTILGAIEWCAENYRRHLLWGNYATPTTEIQASLRQCFGLSDLFNMERAHSYMDTDKERILAGVPAKYRHEAGLPIMLRDALTNIVLANPRRHRRWGANHQAWLNSLYAAQTPLVANNGALSKREIFALGAMVGLLAGCDGRMTGLIDLAVTMGDALMRELDKESEGNQDADIS